MNTTAIESVAVVVPIHDEQERISTAVHSIINASRRVPLPVAIVLVLDACSDRSESIVRRIGARMPTSNYQWIITRHRRASSARSAGVERVAADARRLDRIPQTVAILSTDADSVVPEDWIQRHLVHLDDGVDAVAGVVDLLRDADACGFYDQWRSEYQENFGADGSHPHVHAANLAVRLSCLEAAGGFGHEHRAEDLDLWRRLRTSSAVRMHSDPFNVVLTSGRSDGRVIGGFATALNRMFRTDESHDGWRSNASPRSDASVAPSVDDRVTTSPTA